MAYTVLPCGSDVKEPVRNAGDQDLIPGSGRLPGEGNGNPLQYSCLDNSMDRGAWGFAESDMIQSLTLLLFTSHSVMQNSVLSVY